MPKSYKSSVILAQRLNRPRCLRSILEAGRKTADTRTRGFAIPTIQRLNTEYARLTHHYIA